MLCAALTFLRGCTFRFIPASPGRMPITNYSSKAVKAGEIFRIAHCFSLPQDGNFPPTRWQWAALFSPGLQAFF